MEERGKQRTHRSTGRSRRNHFSVESCETSVKHEELVGRFIYDPPIFRDLSVSLESEGGVCAGAVLFFNFLSRHFIRDLEYKNVKTIDNLGEFIADDKKKVKRLFEKVTPEFAKMELASRLGLQYMGNVAFNFLSDVSRGYIFGDNHPEYKYVYAMMNPIREQTNEDYLNACKFFLKNQGKFEKNNEMQRTLVTPRRFMEAMDGVFTTISEGGVARLIMSYSLFHITQIPRTAGRVLHAVSLLVTNTMMIGFNVDTQRAVSVHLGEDRSEDSPLFPLGQVLQESLDKELTDCEQNLKQNLPESNNKGLFRTLFSVGCKNYISLYQMSDEELRTYSMDASVPTLEHKFSFDDKHGLPFDQMRGSIEFNGIPSDFIHKHNLMKSVVNPYKATNADEVPVEGEILMHKPMGDDFKGDFETLKSVSQNLYSSIYNPIKLLADSILKIGVMREQPSNPPLCKPWQNEDKGYVKVESVEEQVIRIKDCLEWELKDKINSLPYPDLTTYLNRDTKDLNAPNFPLMPFATQRVSMIVDKYFVKRWYTFFSLVLNSFLVAVAKSTKRVVYGEAVIKTIKNNLHATARLIFLFGYSVIKYRNCRDCNAYNPQYAACILEEFLFSTMLRYSLHTFKKENESQQQVHCALSPTSLTENYGVLKNLQSAFVSGFVREYDLESPTIHFLDLQPYHSRMFVLSGEKQYKLIKTRPFFFVFTLVNVNIPGEHINDPSFPVEHLTGSEVYFRVTQKDDEKEKFYFYLLKGSLEKGKENGYNMELRETARDEKKSVRTSSFFFPCPGEKQNSKRFELDANTVNSVKKAFKTFGYTTISFIASNICDRFVVENMVETGESLCIGGVLDRVIEEGHGDRIAINYLGKVCTFREHSEMSLNIAAHLQRLCGVGERVGISLGDALETFATYMGCYRCGAVNVPVNPRNSAREMTNVLCQSTPRVFIVHEALVEQLNKVDLGRTVVDVILLWGDMDKIDLNTTKGVVKCGSFEELLRERERNRDSIVCLNYEKVLGNESQLVFSPLSEVDEDSDAVILFTSGSTGNPKGVLHTQRNIMQDNAYFGRCFGFDQVEKGEDVVFLTCVASEHGSGVFMHCSMIEYALTWYFIPGSIPCEGFVEAVASFMPTHIMGLTAQFQMMINHPRVTEEILGRVKMGIAGGDTVTTKLKEAFFLKTGAPLVIMYGSTESNTNTANWDSDPANISIGCVTEGCDIKIVDSEGKEVPVGVVGEMLLKHRSMFKEYFNNPEATQKAFTEDGWYRSGDAALKDKNGRFTFCGRIKNMIKYRTLTIHANEIEEALLTHPNVGECAAVGKKDSVYGELPCCYVSAKVNPATSRPFDMDEEELLLFLGKDMLAAYKIPRKIIVLDELPKGKSGKIDRMCLKRRINGEEGVVPLDVAVPPTCSGFT
eukprot:Nk52_evm4s426 gene=Nk52_evmTU4s426